MNFDDLQRLYALSMKVTCAPYLLNYVYFMVITFTLSEWARSKIII